VKATGAQLKTVQSVIEKLDKRRAQVFVETIIAEVSLNQMASLGIDWGIGGARTVGGTTTDDGGTTAATTIGNLIDTNRPSLPAATIGATGGGNGLDFSLLDFGRYQLDVVLNAIANDTDSNVLSTPTILTLDNEEAEIIIGQEVPFITGTFNNGFNTTNPDGTDNSTVGNGFQTIERRDVGLSLRIKPQINDGDTIQLEVFQETSNVVETDISDFSDVVTNRRSIEAVVQVDDGQVVVLGGLISDNVTDSVTKVPFLGDLPLVGNLFRSKSKTANKQNLMVFLKPHIIRSPEDLAKISRAKYRDVRQDSQIAARQNPSFIINDSAAPILVDYDEGLNEGFVGSERRAKLAKDGIPRTIPGKVKDIIFGRKTKKKKTFVTDGELEAIEGSELNSELETELDSDLKAINESLE